MKFKSIISRNSLLNLLTITSSFEKVGKDCVLYLTNDVILISLIPENSDAIRLYCDLKVAELFESYIVESKSQNTILLRFNIEHFSKSLSSGKNALECCLKLAKRNSMPVLCFQANASGGLTIDIFHDIPIQLLKATEIIHYQHPTTPPPQVALLVETRTKSIKSILDKMNKFSKSVTLTASQAGRLTLRVAASCTITTHINGLQRYNLGNLTEHGDGHNCASVQVDIKKLSTLFTVGQSFPKEVVLCKLFYEMKIYVV